MGLTDKDKLNLIRDSLIGVSYHLPTPEVFLYPFLDNLLLLHQRPLVFALWRDDCCVYSSLKDSDFENKITWDRKPDNAIKIAETGYHLAIHDFSRPATGGQGKKFALSIDENATALTQQLIESFEPSNPIFTQLKQAIDKIAQHDSKTPSPAENPNDMDYDEVKGFLEPMRRVFDEVFVDAIGSDVLTIKEDSPKQPNIFAVIRTRPWSKPRYKGKFGYTAGLFLLSQTKDLLKSWCVSKCCLEKRKECKLQYKKPEECISAIEQPLGLNSRAVSDLVFSSGLIDFGRRAGEPGLDISVDGSDRFDQERRYVEGCIYPSDRGLLYIPIHVGGTPWIAIFTFAQAPSTQDAWYHNYSFYRDLMQKSAALIRQKAHDCYAELVAKTLVKHMESWAIPKETVIDYVNTEMQKLTQVYPFPILKLHLEPLDGGKRISVSDRGIFEVSFKQNPFFPRQVDWNIGNENEILCRCQEALKKFEEIKHSAETKTATQLLKVVGVESLTDGDDFDNIIGSSIVMRSVYALIRKASAVKDVTVFITGEHGTGKELVARAIHSKSTRSDSAFVTLNCAAIPKDLLESELFGYVKGAFTGAIESKKGKFEAANGGTLFLDEIGDMLPELQAKLLRAIQEKEFHPVGAEEPVKVDIRIIAATNQNLQKAIEEGKFREDLYYRLYVFPIQLPSLRARKEDIPFLTKHFLEKNNKEYIRKVGISDGALNRLTEYSWPGNVRELENVIHRLVIMCDGEEIRVEHLPQEFQQSVNNSHIDKNLPELVCPVNFVNTGADWNTVVRYLKDCLNLVTKDPSKKWNLIDVGPHGAFKAYINTNAEAIVLVVQHNYEKLKTVIPILQKNSRCRTLLKQ